MAASQFTIYMLDTDYDFDFENTVTEIVDVFNSNCDEDDKEFSLERKGPFQFTNNRDYKLYTRAAKTKPDWSPVLSELSASLENVENVNHSYVLFVHVNNKIFAITGGGGYQLIDSSKVFYFGLYLLSRIVSEDDNYIKGVVDKYFVGNKIGGGTQYINNVTINAEQNTNNMFKEIKSALPKGVIKDKLGIDININKENYRFIAKDSIRLGKALALPELENLLFSISNLMDETPSYSILPFCPINKKDPIITDLNAIMISYFVDFVNLGLQTDDFMLTLFYESCERHYFKMKSSSNSLDEFSDLDELLIHFENNVDISMDSGDILDAIKIIQLTGKIENRAIYNKSFYDHIDAKITYKDANYWLTEGSWFKVERDFIENLNHTFLQKVTNAYDFNFRLNSIRTWASGSEGEYNFSHQKTTNTFVLDRIFVNNIEMCDLLIEEQGNLYFVHVKDNLDRDVRVLVHQIEHAMTTLSETINYNGRELRSYYQSIKNKTIDSKTTSTISYAAKKVINQFTDEDSFVDYIMNFKDNITFVFAFRPKEIHDLNDPKTISSTAAKLSMIHLVQIANDFNFDLQFLEINRHSELKLSNSVKELATT